MEYWTILIITALGGTLDGESMVIAYPSYEACEAATTAVSATLAYDHQLECEATGTASGSIRPVRNPAYGGE